MAAKASGEKRQIVERGNDHGFGGFGEVRHFKIILFFFDFQKIFSIKFLFVSPNVCF